MEFNLDRVMEWLFPVGIVIASFIVGLIIEFIVIKSFVRITKGTKWKWDDILAKSFSHAFIYWSVYIGAAVAANYAPLEAGTTAYIHRILWALALLIVVVVFTRIAYGATELLTVEHGGPLPGGSLLPNTTRVLVLILGLFFVLANMGINIVPVIGALGIGGLAVALAFQDTLGNLFSGFQIIATGKVTPGNFIQLDSGEIGYVVDITWRDTTIRDFNNNLIIVPNSKVSGSIVTNFNLPYDDIYMELTCGVGYESDLEKVESVVKEIGKRMYKEVFGEELETDPSFFYLAFGESSVDFKTKILVKQFGDRIKLQHAVIKEIHRRFAEEGINIPFPIRTIEYASGSGAGA